MRKSIGFAINEQTQTKDVIIENGIYNAFGKMASLPSIIYKQILADNFSSNELGDLFVQMGYMLKRLGKDITNIELKSKFLDSISDVGKVFMVELQYDEKWYKAELTI